MPCSRRAAWRDPVPFLYAAVTAAKAARVQAVYICKDNASYCDLCCVLSWELIAKDTASGDNMRSLCA